MNQNPYFQRRVRKIGPKIDIGCGSVCRDGFIGIDIMDHKQDILWDVREGIPIPNGTVIHVFTSHFVEHLTEQDLMTFWREVVRVCKNGAIIDIRCPHSSTTEADFPSHFSRWNEKRISGVVQGFQGNPRANKGLRIVKCKKEGNNLVATLTVYQK